MRLEICPRTYLRGAWPMINRALELWAHWSRGELSAFVPEPSPVVGELVQLVEQEVRAVHLERLPKPQGGS